MFDVVDVAAGLIGGATPTGPIFNNSGIGGFVGIAGPAFMCDELIIMFGVGKHAVDVLANDALVKSKFIIG